MLPINNMVEKTFSPTSSAVRSGIQSPFPGLRHYEERDANWFYGRSKERKVILSHAFGAGLTIYYGDSGVGKTSLLLADVIPVLKGRKDRTDETWKRNSSVAVVLFRKWRRPDFELMLRRQLLCSVLRRNAITKREKGAASLPAVNPRRFTKQFVEQLATMAAQPAPQTKAARIKLWNSVSLVQIARVCCQLYGGRILLILDQFEEYFRYHSSAETCNRFDADFAALVQQSDIPVNVFVSLREEAIAKLDRYQVAIPKVFAKMLRIRHLSESGVKDAINKPLELYKQWGDVSFVLEDKLVKALVRIVLPRERPVNQSVSLRAPAKSGAGVGQIPVESVRQKLVTMRRYRGTSYLQILLEATWREMIESGGAALSRRTLMDAAKKFSYPGSSQTERDGKSFRRCAERIADGYVWRMIGKDLDAKWATMTGDERGQFASTDPDRAREVAALGLAVMVTPGGAKIAQTVGNLSSIIKTGLVEEARDIPPEEIDSAMRLLGTVNLIKPAGTGTNFLENSYELTHDVLGVALDKWREGYTARRAEESAIKKQRQRLLERTKKVLQYAMGVVILAALVLLWQLVEAWGDKKRMQIVRDADRVLQFCKAAKSPSDFLVSQVSALSLLPAQDSLAPSQALVALRFSSAITGSPDMGASQAVDVETRIQEMSKSLPYILSRNSKWNVTLERKEPNTLQPVVWNTTRGNKRAFELPPVNEPVTAMGFDRDSKTLFVETTQGTAKMVFKWEMESKLQSRVEGDINELADSRSLIRFQEPLYYSYSEARGRWVLEALSGLAILNDEQKKEFELENPSFNTVRVVEALAEAETDVKAGIDSLSSALSEVVAANPKDAARAIAWRLSLRGGNEGATGKKDAKKTARELYKKAITAYEAARRENTDDAFYLEFNNGVFTALTAEQVPSDAEKNNIADHFVKAMRQNLTLWRHNVKPWLKGSLMDASAELNAGNESSMRVEASKLCDAIYFTNIFNPALSALRQAERTFAPPPNMVVELSRSDGRVPIHPFAPPPNMVVELFETASRQYPAIWKEYVKEFTTEENVTPANLVTAIQFSDYFNEGMNKEQKGREGDGTKWFEKAYGLSPQFWNAKIQTWNVRDGGGVQELVAAIAERRNSTKGAAKIQK